MPVVTLLHHTPEPERLIAAAARLCYSDQSVEGLMEGLDAQKAESFVRMLAGMGHESPVEHVSFTFAIEGVSRSLLAQITRHRIASYSVQSQRYVHLGAPEYVTPPAIAADPAALARYEQAMRQASDAYAELTRLLREKHRAALEEEGVSPKKADAAAEKMALEDARFVLPNACCTRMVVTMNARSLYNFFRHRCCNRAQWEIRAVADRMLEEVRRVAPTLFELCGPPCVAGPCPEGKMTCGKAEAVRARYKGGEPK